MEEKRFKLLLQKRANENVGTRGQASEYVNEHAPGNPDKLAEYWGSIKTLSGRELEIARAQVTTARVRIKVFADSTFEITSKKRFLLSGTTRVFPIGHYYSVDELGHEIVCLCGEEIP